MNTELARRLLKSLVESGLPFVVVGSFARALRGLPLERPPADVDLVLGPGALVPFVAWVEARGGAVRVWGQPWAPGWNEARLAGKHYVRATIEGLQLDASFERNPGQETLFERLEWLDGLPLAAQQQAQ